MTGNRTIAERTCPACSGSMRRSKFAYICAQDGGPCGMLVTAESRHGTHTTTFRPTRFDKRMGFQNGMWSNEPWVRYYIAGETVTPKEYLRRATGLRIKEMHR